MTGERQEYDTIRDKTSDDFVELSNKLDLLLNREARIQEKLKQDKVQLAQLTELLQERANFLVNNDAQYQYLRATKEQIESNIKEISDIFRSNTND